MPSEVIKQMLEVGAHFGHKTSHWNPKMGDYIFGARNGIHIIDLQKTEGCLTTARAFLVDLVAHGGDVLFVGTKRQAQELVAEHAKRVGMFFVNHRWLGGTLTNYRTIRGSISRLKDMERRKEEGSYEGLTKKERLGIDHEITKLTKVLGGIKDMEALPKAVFVVDSEKEKISIQEARKLGIPVIALIDTNCNPDGIDYIVPGNDDAMKSIHFFISYFANACEEGVQHRDQVARAAARAEEQTKEGVPGIRETVIKEKAKAYVGEDRQGRKGGKKATPANKGTAAKSATIPEVQGGKV